MTKTLYVYLSRDLVKVTLMALVVLTMIFTILGAIEPMRRYGLTGSQILDLFGYLIPVVLPLTLPISALFGATFVYGRFSRSNELLASKGSGISAVALLRPAFVLGAIVTAASLGISNYLAPAMAEQLGHAVEEDLKGLASQGLRTRGYVSLSESRFLHADEVDRECREIHGIVAVKVKKPGVVRLVVVPSGRAWMAKKGGKPQVRFEVDEAAVMWSNRYNIMRMDKPSLDPMDPPNLAKEKASWYTWDELRATLRDPSLNGKIHDRLLKTHYDLCAEKLGQRVVEAINVGGGYRTDDESDRYILLARAARSISSNVVELSEGPQRVKITVSPSGKIAGHILADAGSISTGPSTDGRGTTATIVLTGDIKTRTGRGETKALGRQQWPLAGLALGDDDGLADVVDAVVRGTPYVFSDGADRYTLTAGWAEVDDTGAVALSTIRPVTLVITDQTDVIKGQTNKVVTANSGTLTAIWHPGKNEMTTSVVLGGGLVTVRTTRWRRDGLVVPEGFASDEAFIKDVAKALGSRVDYDFRDDELRYTLSAGQAEVTKGGTVKLSSAVRANGRKRVDVVVKTGQGTDSRTVHTVSADDGEISVHRPADGGKPTALIELSGNIDVGRHKNEWTSPRGLPIPKDIAEEVKSPDLAGVCRRAEEQSKDKNILSRVRNTRREIGYLHWEIVAEMHGRMALGLSGVLLVVAGAALGLIFRGGQVLSAFALSFAPAVVAYVMVIMGEQMVTNPKVAPWMGLAAIWSGDALLALGNACIYGWAIRR